MSEFLFRLLALAAVHLVFNLLQHLWKRACRTVDLRVPPAAREPLRRAPVGPVHALAATLQTEVFDHEAGPAGAPVSAPVGMLAQLRARVASAAAAGAARAGSGARGSAATAGGGGATGVDDAAVREMLQEHTRLTPAAKPQRLLADMEVVEGLAAASLPTLASRVAIAVGNADILETLGDVHSRTDAEQTRELLQHIAVGREWWQGEHGVSTLATFDRATGDYVLHTPDAAPSTVLVFHGDVEQVDKVLITARVRTSLTVEGDVVGGEAAAPEAADANGVAMLDHGEHIFCFSLRRAGTLLPGVHLNLPQGASGDRHPSITVTFNNVRIDRPSLLPALGSVSRSGRYDANPRVGGPGPDVVVRGIKASSHLLLAASHIGLARQQLVATLRAGSPRTCPPLHHITCVSGVAAVTVLRPALRIVAASVHASLRRWQTATTSRHEAAKPTALALALFHTVSQTCEQVCRETSDAIASMAPHDVLPSALNAEQTIRHTSVLAGVSASQCAFEAGKLLVMAELHQPASRPWALAATARQVFQNIVGDPDEIASIVGTFRARERLLLELLTRKARRTLPNIRGDRRRGDATPPAAFWDDHAEDVVALAEAYAERHLVEAFVSLPALQPKQGNDATPLMLQVFTLYALDRIVRSPRWFVATGALDASAVRKLHQGTDAPFYHVRRLVMSRVPTLAAALGAGIAK